MSLRLFANYENTGNSSIFYRLTSVSPYVFKLRLDNDDPTSSYLVEYSLNNNLSARVLFDEDLTAFVTLTAQTPGVQVITVSAFDDQNFNLPPVILGLSAVFVPYFLSADYIAYPQGFVTPFFPKYRYSDQYASQEAYLADLNLYGTGIGNAFYGEGHTESVALSAKTLFAGCSASWGVGPYVIETKQRTTTAIITSNSNEFVIHPVSLQLYNNTFIKDGPSIAYFEELSGTPSYYPFYTSSLTVTGLERTNGSTFQKSLSVLKYPEPEYSGYPLVFTPSISGANISLPLDSTRQLFTAYFDHPVYDTSVFLQQYDGSAWSLDATANPFGVNPDWSLTTTKLSASIKNFKFQLSYSDQYSIDNILFRASAGYVTNLNVGVSAYKIIGLQNYDDQSNRFTPNRDWFPRYQIIPFSVSTTILPLPVTDLYVANYYNLTGTNVKVTNVWSSSSVEATPSSTVILYKTLSSTSLSGGESDTFFFNSSDLGIVGLSAKTTFFDSNNDIYSKLYHAPEILEVVNSYDDVEPKYFNSQISPLVVTHNTVPRLTPNEWVTSDNVNSVIDEFTTALNELDQFTSVYTLSTTKITGRLEQNYIQPGFTTGLTLSSYLLPDGSILTYNFNIPITTYETESRALSSLTVFGSNPDDLVSFPIFVRATVPTIPGTEYKWITPYIDPVAFYNWPVPSLSSNTHYVGMVVLPKSEKIILAYEKSVCLIENNYTSRAIDTVASIDQIFEFQSVKNVQSTTQDYVVVLDAAFPRISVYTISNDSLNLFTTWGSFGFAASKQGLNKPEDFHIDQQDLIWVADTGNNCVKKFTLTGKNLLTITHKYLDKSAPLSVCVDSQYNAHVLTNSGVYVFDSNGLYLFTYTLPEEISGIKKINTSYNREAVYITHSTGVIKYFRTGTIYQYTINNQSLTDETTLQGYNSVYQDKFRNLYITVKDQIIRVADLMKLKRNRSQDLENLLWSSNELHVHKDEYVQPWVYIKSFHRLWDNIELFRNSLFYDDSVTGFYTPPVYKKSELVIGQNEIVTNAVINRLSSQLWANLRSIINYFNVVNVPPISIEVETTPVVTEIPTLTVTETPAPTPTPTPTFTYPADGIVDINDNSIYMVDMNNTTTYLVTGAKIPQPFLLQENNNYVLQEDGLSKLIIE